MQEITVKELKEKMDAGEDFQLIDVRQPNEWEIAKIEGAKLIPLGEIVNRMDELDDSKEIVMQCKSGGRSARAMMMLEQAGYKGEMKNLVGGIGAWSAEIDPNVPQYNLH
ncbi:MAG: rhodanese-like domain-containing protein [Aridibacter sp.]|jgi:adenylyltransferase/sulfurtransferase|nr:rhodanese-like domain-containing protein [Acidobacteriota bacterium]